MPVRTHDEYQRAKRVVANCPTDALQRVHKDPIQATDPHQRALNEEFQTLVKEELDRRGRINGSNRVSDETRR